MKTKSPQKVKFEQEWTQQKLEDDKADTVIESNADDERALELEALSKFKPGILSSLMLFYEKFHGGNTPCTRQAALNFINGKLGKTCDDAHQPDTLQDYGLLLNKKTVHRLELSRSRGVALKGAGLKLKLRKRGFTEIPLEKMNELLVSLDLRDNFISKIVKMTKYIHLIDLDLECNRIIRIRGLTSNINLRTLRLGKNSINSI